MKVKLVFRWEEYASLPGEAKALERAAEQLSLNFHPGTRGDISLEGEVEDPQINISSYRKMVDHWFSPTGEGKATWETVFINNVQGIELPCRPYMVTIDGVTTQTAGHFGQDFHYPSSD